MLEHFGAYPPVVEQERRVVELTVARPGRADQERRSPVAGIPGELADAVGDGILKRGLEDQVLGRIARDRELARDHQIGGVRAGLGAGPADALDVCRPRSPTVGLIWASASARDSVMGNPCNRQRRARTGAAAA